MKRTFFVLALLAGALARTADAQEILVGADFKMYFDNKEFGSNTFAVPGFDIESGTDFAARLMPRIGIRWEEKNTLFFGADMLQNFGEQNSSFVSEIKPVIYYQFQTQHVRAVAGIFTRDLMHDEDYSTAFFTEAHRFTHDRMNGVLAQYNGRRDSYVEFVCDWEGMYSTVSREKFRILLAGRHYLNTFYYGFNYSMFHFAGKKDLNPDYPVGEGPEENVVDLQLLTPCVGVKFNAFFDFDIKLGALISAQRDRSYGHRWETPCMGEFAFRMSRWGLTLDERLYVGDNLHPFFFGHTLDDGTCISYGRELYPGESFFRTTENVYSRTSLSYRRSFFADTLTVGAEFVAHHDGTALGTQQMLTVGVKLLKPVYNSKNHKK